MMTTQDWKTCREIRMNEFDAAPHVNVEWTEIFKFVGYGIFAILVWILKKFGEDHLLSMKELAVELKEMRKELNVLATRVTAVEIRAEHWQRDES